MELNKYMELALEEARISRYIDKANQPTAQIFKEL